MNTISDTSNAVAKFILQKEDQSKISSLMSIDSDETKMTFSVEKGKAWIKGKSFKFNLGEVDTQSEGSVSIFKKHYQYLDNEVVNVCLMADKVIFKSTESETLLVVGEVE
jgi:hypothetical protein